MQMQQAEGRFLLLHIARCLRSWAYNWVQLVGRQWGTVTQKMKKGAEGTNTRGHLRRSRQNSYQLSNRNIS
jgi:hypothetical protein